MATKTTTASKLNPGVRFTDDMGHTHYAARIDRPNDRGVYVYVDGQDYPEFYLNETVLTVHVPAKPYYVMTRYVARNGELAKGRREFATRAAQCRYIRTAPGTVAITSYN